MRSTAAKVRRVRCLDFYQTVRRLISAKFMTWRDNDLKTTRTLGADGEVPTDLVIMESVWG